jgi:hypothetical protein
MPERPPPGTGKPDQMHPDRAHFVSSFGRGDTVHIDGDSSIKATVCAHLFRENFITVECSWFSNGALQTQWIEEWRLSPA